MPAFSDFFECPICEEISSQEEWNQRTIKVFGDNIALIHIKEGGRYFHTYICPVCDKRSQGEDIKRH